MKLRTKFVLAFLGLAIVPLAGLVIYSYITSVRALREAVEEQSRDLAQQIETNMAMAQGELLQNWRDLGALDFPTANPADFEATLARAMDEMGPWAQLVRRWEFRPPVPPAPGPAPSAVVAARRAAEPTPSSLQQGGSGSGEGPSRPDQPWSQPRIVWVEPEWEGDNGQNAEMRGVELGEDGTFAAPAPGADRQWRFSLAPRELEARRPARRALERASQRISEQLAGLEEQLAQRQRDAERTAERVARGKGDTHAAADAAIAAGAVAADVERLRRKELWIDRVLETEVALPAGDIGTLGAEIDEELFFRAVLRATPHDPGAIPFALDGQGNLYFRDEDDRNALLAVSGLSEDDFAEVCREGLWRDTGWVLATRPDEQTGVVYGIARPIDDSLDQIRRTTGRNFLMGIGMIGLSLFGILPLSSRLTRGLQSLSDEVDRLASGEEEARVEVRGRDELAQLAHSFNHMASQLKDQREQLLEQERRGREQELAQRLLEAENERRGEELEAARRFQLSMLPRSLPRIDGLEIGVLMRTATEVGGDYYDFLLDHTSAAQEETSFGLTVAVGDATGHGARAGTMVTAVKALLSGSAPLQDLGDFLCHGSQVVKRMGVERMAMSLQLVRVEKRHFELASAGMPPALLWRRGEAAAAGSGSVEELALPGLPLGALVPAQYPCRRVAWSPGDVLVLMSDGLLEQTDAEGAPLGYERLRTLLAKAMEECGERPSAQQVVDCFAAEVERVTGGAAPADDVTFVVLRNVA